MRLVLSHGRPLPRPAHSVAEKPSVGVDTHAMCVGSASRRFSERSLVFDLLEDARSRNFYSCHEHFADCAAVRIVVSSWRNGLQHALGVRLVHSKRCGKKFFSFFVQSQTEGVAERIFEHRENEERSEKHRSSID